MSTGLGLDAKHPDIKVSNLDQVEASDGH